MNIKNTFKVIINAYYNSLTYIYKLGYKLLQLPCNNLKDSFTYKNRFTIIYNGYVIKDIIYDKKSCLYHGSCTYKDTLYSLQGATIDLLINDLIEGISDIELMHINYER